MRFVYFLMMLSKFKDIKSESGPKKKQNERCEEK